MDTQKFGLFFSQLWLRLAEIFEFDHSIKMTTGNHKYGKSLQCNHASVNTLNVI